MSASIEYPQIHVYLQFRCWTINLKKILTIDIILNVADQLFSINRKNYLKTI